ncbi:MAG: DegQ family serine endoprotease [Pseudomonadota bacterium]
MAGLIRKMMTGVGLRGCWVRTAFWSLSLTGVCLSAAFVRADDLQPGVAGDLARAVPRSMQEVQLSFAPVVSKTAPAVVNIYTRRVVKSQSASMLDDPIFRRFFGNRGGFGMPRERVERSLGSGVIVDPDGIIITNNHVVGDADEITIVLADRREFRAEVLLADERTDLAVLKIQEAQMLEEGMVAFPFLELGDSNALEVGDIVLAIGNPFGVGQTVTSGIVSALARTGVGVSDYQFFIQTDAAVNPGNSGGALVGLDGKLVGVNTAIFSRSGGSNGIGFAIPVDMVKATVAAATGDGRIVRPWLGARGQRVTADIAESLGLPIPTGVLVEDITQGGPAARGGLRPGDVIVGVAGRDVVDAEGLRFRIATQPVGARVQVDFLRDGIRNSASIILTAPPEKPPRDLRILSGRHLFQGVKVGNLSPAFAEEIGVRGTDQGVVVVDIAPRAPVRRLRVLRPGDILLSINGVSVESTEQLNDYLKTEAPLEVTYAFKRGQKRIECGFRPPSSVACRS